MLTDADLDGLVALVERAGRGVAVDRAQLRDALHELFTRVGLVIDSEVARPWHEAVGPSLRPGELETIFNAMASSADPLATSWPTPVRALLNAAMRRDWAHRRYRGLRPASLAGQRWDTLSGEAQADVRRQLDELAQGAGQRVRPGAPTKTQQNTLLFGLADIFVDFTGFRRPRSRLPHASTSGFIQFSHRALRPYFALTEATPEALARRWRRLKTERPHRPKRSRDRPVRKRLIHKPF